MKASITRAILIYSLVHLGLCYRDDDISELKRQTSSGNRLERSARLQEAEQSIEIEQDGETKRSTETTRQRASPIQNLGERAQTTQNLPFNIIEVRREIVGEGLKFTVKYGSNETTIIGRWEFISGNRGEGINTAVGNKEYETSVLMPASELLQHTSEDRSSLAAVQLYTDSYGEGVTLLLLNGADAVEREIPVPFFEIDPPGDFVYEEGEDVIRKVQVSDRYWLIRYITYLDPETGDVVRDLAGDLVHLTGSDQVGLIESNDEHTLRINTSESRTTGLLTMVYYEDTEFSGPVVLSVNYIKEVAVRPASQAGPFPDGYLGFVKTFPGITPESGHNITVCKVGQTCRMDCIAAGSDITQVKVEKLGNSGTFETLDQEKYDIEEITAPYLKHKAVRFHEESVPERKERDVMRCTAQNAEGKTIAMETSVMVIIPVDIIEEKSGIEMLEDQDDEDMKHFRIVCTVRGYPQPTVELRSGSIAFSHGSPFDDEVLDIGNNTYTTVKYENYAVSDFEYSWSYLSAHCTAFNEELFWDRDYYYMSFDVSLMQQSLA